MTSTELAASDELGKPPALNTAHIKWRVDSEPNTRNGKSTARFVPYVTMEQLGDMLDAWVGPTRWSAMFTAAGHDMWCSITIVTPSGQAVTKTDVGDLDGSAKSAVSDAFKRCATRMWGVGREVRSIPTLWAPCRVYASRGKDIAVANNDTIPTLRRKLADLGHAGVGDTVDGSDNLDPDAQGEPHAAPPLSPDDRTDVLTDALDQLGTQVSTLAAEQLTEWATWKASHSGWQRTLDGVQTAAKTVTDLLEQQAAVVVSDDHPDQKATDEPF